MQLKSLNNDLTKKRENCQIDQVRGEVDRERFKQLVKKCGTLSETTCWVTNKLGASNCLLLLSAPHLPSHLPDWHCNPRTSPQLMFESDIPRSTSPDHSACRMESKKKAEGHYLQSHPWGDAVKGPRRWNFFLPFNLSLLVNMLKQRKRRASAQVKNMFV